MNKPISVTIALVALLSIFAFSASAQAILTPTTLSAAIADGAAKTMLVASATGFTANTTSAYIDKELVTVEAINSTTITIIRGQGGTPAAAHASGALVFVAASNLFFSKPPAGLLPNGSCTRGNELVLPYINVANGVISDCLGGKWTNGVTTANPRFRIEAPAPGGTAYTSLNTSGTAVGATTLYCTEVNLPYNKLLTGIGVLNGTTVTGNARYVVLYDASGNALANSALAGQASVTASVYETYAFTSKFFGVGPSQYFACLQDNAVGSTTVRMAVTGTNDNLLTKGQTGATFGTVPALTVPTTFTTAVGPYIYLY